MIKFFVSDTNTLISANLLPDSVNRKAFNKAREIGIPVYSIDTLSEFSKTLIRPKFDKYVSQTKRLDAIVAYENIGQLLKVTVKIERCHDPKDDKFLELAVEGGATCIITGDKDLLVLHPFKHIPIITAANFLKVF